MAKVHRSRVVERAGVNMVRSLFERDSHIVQEISGGNDYGEDLYVSLVADGRRTGDVVAIQVKSGTSYRAASGYRIKCDGHAEDWARSRVPVVGIVYDPEMKMLYWANLTQRIREAQNAGKTPKSIAIDESSNLDHRTLSEFVHSLRSFLAKEPVTRRPATTFEILRRALVTAPADRRAAALLARHQRDVDEPVGGRPNQLGRAYLATLERLPVRPIGFALLAVVTIGLISIQFEGIGGAVEEHFTPKSMPTGVWLAFYAGFYCFLVAFSFERVGGRLARGYRIATPVLWTIGWALCVPRYFDAWPVNPRAEALFVNMLPTIAKYTICFSILSLVLKEVDRRRRLRALYAAGDGRESDHDGRST